ncbi:MAG: hypothetical protein JSW66_12915 [Phycisphaerales bacterium]|nr:MAG: hypothetical protein JSW66_12915 [Phycisphaerales bacterium]
MKMIKRTLIAFAVIAFVASIEPAVAAIDTGFGSIDTESYPPFAIYNFDKGQSDDFAVKVDGKKTVRWPFQYEWLTICKIPLQMNIGMFIRVKDCDKAEIILEQVDCADIGADDDEWPCYEGCLDNPSKLKVTSNFDAELQGKVVDTTGVVNKKKTDVEVTPDEISAGSTDVEVCVTAWEVEIEEGEPGTEVDVGYVALQARPLL